MAYKSKRQQKSMHKKQNEKTKKMFFRFSKYILSIFIFCIFILAIFAYFYMMKSLKNQQIILGVLLSFTIVYFPFGICLRHKPILSVNLDILIISTCVAFLLFLFIFCITKTPMRYFLLAMWLLSMFSMKAGELLAKNWIKK